MTRLVSHIYRRGEAPRRTPAEIEAEQVALRRRAWHELGIAIFDPADINDDWTRQAIRNEANKLYGRRKRA